MNNKIKVSVRTLVEFLMRSGSLDNRFGGMDRAAEGSRIHRTLQKQAGDSYSAEVALSIEAPCGVYTLLIQGRADGVITDSSGVMIDEIKSTATPLHLIDDSYSGVHWAQAMCYAYIYSVQNNLESIRVRLTYYNIETDEIKHLVRNHTYDSLEIFFSDLIGRYRIWNELQQSWTGTRNVSIKASQFPFKEYRKGQRKLAVAVYRTIQKDLKLYCQAPTGIGKTISTLFPSVKAMGEGHAEKIFYLTAKTITRQVAEEACNLLKKDGLKLKTVTFTAKDKICFLEKRECNPDACRYAKGHFDRVNDALFAALQVEDTFTRDLIEQYAEEYTVCPFEYMLDLSLWCDCVIADYNYVFDPKVYLRRFFDDKPGDYIFLIDEAHNLVDRSREMYSAKLSKSSFLQMKKLLDKKDKLTKSLTRVNKAMLEIRKECVGESYLVKKDQYSDLQNLLFSFSSACEEWLKNHPRAPQSEPLLNLFFEVYSYLKISELYDERYVTIVETNRSEVTLRLFCLDPSFLLEEAMKRGKSAILFSATLTPLQYFTSILGGGDSGKNLLLPSPFPRDNLCLLISNRISTKYKDRSSSLRPISDQIVEVVKCKTGNYIVYFPSYSYMKAVYDVFCEENPHINTIIQHSAMDEQEREEFLNLFSTDNTQSMVGFCVLGGIYSEGIDLKGDRLIGAIIVGVGLPQINLEQDIIRSYFNKINNSGFAYAYMYPGMNKVLQAAGRVIRSATDKGVVLLIDERFTNHTYRQLLPDHWAGYKTISNTAQIAEHIKPFWEGSFE